MKTQREKNVIRGFIMISALLSLFGCRCKPKDVYVGDGAFILHVPSNMIVEKDEKGTTVIYQRNNDDAIIRISFISFKPKDPNETEGGLRIVQSNINEKKYESLTIGDRLIAHWQENINENGEELILKYWEFGYQNNLIILSVTITKSEQNTEKVRRIIGLVPTFLQSIRSAQTQGAIETTEGQIEYTSTQVDENFKHYELNAKDEQSIAEHEKLGLDVLYKYLDANDVAELDFKKLDLAFKSWLNDNDERKISEDTIANGLGIIFGIKLIDSLDMEWKKVTDEYGTDYVVWHKSNNTMAFPVSSVYKRIEARETDFFWSIYQMIKNRIEEKE